MLQYELWSSTLFRREISITIFLWLIHKLHCWSVIWFWSNRSSASLVAKGLASGGVRCCCVSYLYNGCYVMVWFISYSFELHYFTVSCFYSVLLEYFMELFYCTSWDWIAWLFFSIITEIIILFNLYCYAVHFKCKASLFISDCWLFDSIN